VSTSTPRRKGDSPRPPLGAATVGKGVEHARLCRNVGAVDGSYHIAFRKAGPFGR
jgi:hypothetical protein